MFKDFDRLTIFTAGLALATIVFLLLFEPGYGDCHMEGLDKVCKLTAWVRR